MAVFSKIQTIPTTCIEYVHPWTDSCSSATTFLALCALQDSFRIYVTVYMLALLMRGKIPSQKDIKRTIMGIAQSTAFLTCHAGSFSLVTCLMRRILGRFSLLTVSFLPAFISSYISILVERPSRRGLLSLYVTNVASETLFRMAVWRGMVRPVRHGEVLIFTISMTALLYFYKSQHTSQDSIYSLIRFIVGPYEEKGYKEENTDTHSGDAIQKPGTDRKAIGPHSKERDGSRTSRKSYRIVATCCAVINFFVETLKFQSKHPTCPHPFSCLYYTLQGALKLFSVGYGLQVCLRLLLSIKKIVRNPLNIPSQLFHKDAFHFGAFLGSFSGIYRVMSCLQRRFFNKDSKYNAIPAGLMAGVTFAYFPFNTIALYVMWKSLQMMYNDRVEMGQLPELPGATILLYCLSTAILFHAALVEPQNLRPSYWKFLFNLSGGRIGSMDRKPLDAFGLETSKALAEVVIKTKTRLIPVSSLQ